MVKSSSFFNIYVHVLQKLIHFKKYTFMEQKLTVYSAYYKLFLKMLGSKRLANVAEKNCCH